MKSTGKKAVKKAEEETAEPVSRPVEAEVNGCVVIEQVTPEIDGGKFAAKAIAGEPVAVEADIFSYGHDLLGACVRFRCSGDSLWEEAPMAFSDNDRWQGAFTPAKNGRYAYTLQAWMDPVRTWLRNIEKKASVYPSVQSDVFEGIELFKKVRGMASAEDREDVNDFIKQLKKTQGASPEVLKLIADPRVKKWAGRYSVREHCTDYGKTLELIVDRKRADFGAWYELFPRSQGRVAGQSATFKDCIARLPEIKQMGFDVIYLAPIHPIGRTNRKGPNNTLMPLEDSPGSPWAIGGPEGGHKAIHPDLGTEEDFREFVRAASEQGIEIALDVAYQCSPDHPYVTEHPDWFFRLPDGHIRYAENPPKKYEDIYPLNFNCRDREAMWEEMKNIILYWVERGVKIFRVDNPHTKPLPFWKWMIESVQKKHPDVLFLAEAFTRPKIMKYLAKSGFTQSYTYFTWRNSKTVLRQYLEELTQTEMKDYFRGNFFVNTPDILHEFLQTGGESAFKIRLVLAATLSSTYGIYSGFELCENRPKAPGSEEYLDSEKYQYKVWDWDRPGHIKDFVARVNRVRAENPALRLYGNLEFYESANDHILCYGKRTPDNGNILVVIVNLDPFNPHEDIVCLPLDKFGIEASQTFQAKDLLTGNEYSWRGSRNYVRLDPSVATAHIFEIRK
ncbi:MAG: alpha-1,4-glucan--maltose-1-phosphate maltosyltransferase [Candidatus Omnitrophota bacterium]|jgi:starch synthase (maltosyl-transferring)